MRSAILCILSCSCLAAQNAASIEGVVLDTATQKPLPGVHINLRAGELVSYGALSDKDGQISIAGIPPDVYLLSAQRNGYVRVPGKEETASVEAEVALGPGQHLTGFVIEMSPRAAIAGRVTDEYGDPMPFVHLEAVPGDLRRRAQSLYADTDDRGQYRMTGLPGAYFVKVSDTGVAEFIPAGRADSGAPAHAVTWYPSAVSREQARAVEATAGRDATGIDIQMVRTFSLTLGGVVTGRGDHPVQVTIVGGDPDPFYGTRKFAMAGPDGKFRVSGLAPGRYSVAAFDYTNTLRSPRVEVSLQATDETGLVLNLTPSAELSGSLKVEGAAPGATLPDRLTVQFQPIGAGVQAKGGDVDPEGRFLMEQVFPARFRVSVVPLPENAYVKSVTLDGAESQSDRLDLTQGAGAARVTVVLSLKGAQVEGAVTDADGKPLGNLRPFVALAATPEDIGGDTIDRAEAGGTFRFTGVRPGKYRLVAIDPRQNTGDHAALKKAFSQAMEFEVHEGDRIEKDVKIAAEAPDGKP